MEDSSVEIDEIELISDDQADRLQRMQSLRRRHWEVLTICCTVVVMLWVLTTDSKRVSLIGLPQFPVPDLCLSKSWFGVECPGCGLTRSCLSLSRGDWRSSLSYHRLGWMMLLLIVVQIPYRIIALCFPSDQPLGGPWPSRIATLVVFSLIANWLVMLMD